MAALGWANPSNIGSTARTSGSQKYVVGAPPGPKSRGGVVTVLGGAMGVWARASRGARTAAPAARPTLAMSVRREMAVLRTSLSAMRSSLSMVSRPAARRRPGMRDIPGFAENHPKATLRQEGRFPDVTLALAP